MSVVLPRSRSRSGAVIAATIREHAGELIPVALLTLIAFGLRVSQVHQSLVGDEVFSYQDIVGQSFGTVVTTVHTGGENSPPLFFVLAWAATKLGDPTTWIRLPSLVLGSATVPVVYMIGRETVGRTAGLIGAAVIALTPFAVYYGIEARPYATMTFFVALSTLALLHAVRHGSRRSWAIYVVAAAAAAYTHYTSIFVLAVQAAWSIWVCRGRVREALIANGLIVLAYIPWLPHVRGKALSVIGSLYPLGVRRVLSDLLRPIPGHPAAPLRAIPTIAGLIAIAVCAVAGLAFAAHRWWRRGHPGLRSGPATPAGLILLLAAATPVGLLLYSLLVTDIWLPRGLSASTPAAAVGLGALIAALPRRLTVLAAAVVVVTLLGGTIRSFDAVYARGPFRQLAEYLDGVAGPREPVALISFVGRPAILAQLHKTHLVTPSLQATFSSTAPGARAYVVLDDVLAQRLKLTTPRPQGFRLVASKHYPGSFGTELLTYQRLPARTP